MCVYAFPLTNVWCKSRSLPRDWTAIRGVNVSQLLISRWGQTAVWSSDWFLSCCDLLLACCWAHGLSYLTQKGRSWSFETIIWLLTGQLDTSFKEVCQTQCLLGIVVCLGVCAHVYFSWFLEHFIAF